VVFRYAPAGREAGDLDAINAAILERVNASGEVFLSHTVVRGSYALRVAVGNLRTREAHVLRAWRLILDAAAALG
jgi:aromatic-L-amino-acid decarboxylase